MFDSPEERGRVELIVTLLAKLYVVLDWTLLDDEEQHLARSAIRTLALTIGSDDSFSDPVIH